MSLKALKNDIVNIAAILESGLPVLIVAPPGGGKTTLIRALENYYRTRNVPVFSLERATLLRIAKMAKTLNKLEWFILTTDDYTTIAESSLAPESVVNVITKLCYDKRYIDPLYKININVKKCAFVCGIQPLYLENLINRDFWDTMIAEKLIRYYMLPSYPIQFTNQETMVNELSSHLTKSEKADPKIPSVGVLEEALETQTAGRAKQYVHDIAHNLAKFSKKPKSQIKLLADRLRFEERLMERVLEYGFSSKFHWRELTVLFWVLASRRGLTYKELANRLKVRLTTKPATEVYVSKIVRSAEELGFVTVIRLKENLVIPSQETAYLSEYWSKKLENLNEVVRSAVSFR